MTAMQRSQATTGRGKRLLPPLDYGVIFAAAALLGLGLVMVASANCGAAANTSL